MSFATGIIIINLCSYIQTASRGGASSVNESDQANVGTPLSNGSSLELDLSNQNHLNEDIMTIFQQVSFQRLFPTFLLNHHLL